MEDGNLKGKIMVMNVKDNVAVAIKDITAGENLTFDIKSEKKYQFTSRNMIAFGHKIAILDIKNNEDIIKGGEVIGVATQKIRQGDHVHTHNVQSKRGKENILLDKLNKEGKL